MATAISRRASIIAPCKNTIAPFLLRWSSSSSVDQPSHHSHHARNHVYLEPTDFVGSWRPVKDPKEAEAKLAMLRRQYAKQVKETRKMYIVEMELQRQERTRKDEAKREEARLEREERKRCKAAAADARAAHRKAFEEEFRQTLLKEKEEKLEYCKIRASRIAAKQNEKKELLRLKSSVWVDEKDLEKKILDVIIDTSPF